MSKGASLDYKCRRCGKVVKDSHVPDGTLAVVYLTIGAQFPKEWGDTAVNMISSHHCSDGNIGVIDLIGCEFDK
ncbi:hypothetical protein [Chengkuizengella axinellae]|uniref:Uncharacterized protein n=1 Tax=Chengkuizengella axinellae TaxID=3064388 RepID=A0ABT9IYF5_9BACL|nr:hypothetical protein [Chengkuizengella sp. 2205SS18-9]MDP5274340.1 hypothetical protein [Chengkuizengella sp. 2205SS18-9]